MLNPQPPTQTPAAGAGGWRAALREDYALAILSLGGLLAVIWLIPMIIYRTLTGNYAAAGVNTVLAVVLGWSAWRAWRKGDTRRPGWVMALALTLGLWAIGWAAQFAALFWAYPAILMMFFLVPARAAALLSLLSVVGAAMLSWQELGGGEGLPFFLVTALLTTALAYMVSQQAHRHIKRWQTLSWIDPLTGVGNRRLLEVELAQALQTGKSVGALALLDLDHFKQVNDTYGHDVGDAVLRDVAAVVQAALRKSDRLYRFGGEEFLLWFASDDLGGAEAVLERVRLAVHEQVPVANGAGRITLSAGVAAHQAHEAWPSCLARADAALYSAKREGRNQVRVAGLAQAVRSTNAAPTGPTGL